IEELFGTPAAFAGSSTQQISTLLATGSTSLSALVPPLVAFGGGQTIFLATRRRPGAGHLFCGHPLSHRPLHALERFHDAGNPAGDHRGIREHGPVAP